MLDVILCFVRLFYRIYLTDSRFLLKDFRMYATLAIQLQQKLGYGKATVCTTVSEITVKRSYLLSL